MFAVVQFPGSNDDRDLLYAMKSVLGAESCLVWHKDTALPAGTQAVLLPGGFSYGDYLRAGSMAQFSPVMADVKRFADAGGTVLGICNGFQILCESGLLPGALVPNRNLQFICESVHLRVEQAVAPFTTRTREGEVLRIPIKHRDGCYFASEEEFRSLEENGQIVLRYCDAQGQVTPDANPNGAVGNTAGVRNRAGNVMGLMPHPEHAVEAALGGTDGIAILGSLIDAVGGGR